jgi:hypothetical protein
MSLATHCAITADLGYDYPYHRSIRRRAIMAATRKRVTAAPAAAVDATPQGPPPAGTRPPSRPLLEVRSPIQRRPGGGGDARPVTRRSWIASDVRLWSCTTGAQRQRRSSRRSGSSAQCCGAPGHSSASQCPNEVSELRGPSSRSRTTRPLRRRRPITRQLAEPGLGHRPRAEPSQRLRSLCPIAVE